MSLFNFKKIPEQNRPIFLRIYDNLTRANRFSSEKLRQIQVFELNRVLQHASKNVPFYKNRIPGNISSLEDFFASVPVLHRQEYQENQEDCIAESLPFGMANTGPIYTSGSTGTPVKVFQTNAVRDWYQALHLRDLEWNGLDPRQSLAAIIFFDKSENAWNGTNRKHWDFWLAQILECGPSHGLTIERDPADQADWLEKINPYYLVTYPSNLELLLDHLNKLSQIQLKGIKTLSEPLCEQLREKLQNRFIVRDTYSCRELGYLASECEYGKLHLHSENVILEIVNERFMPCAPGETGQVLLTSLHNYISPLFRYAVGDRAAFGTTCLCGRQHPIIERIEGKIHPPFRIHGGKFKNSIEVHSGMRKIGGCKQFQVIQRKTSFEVNLVPNHEWSAELIPRIQFMLENFYESKVNVKVNVTSRIPLHKGKLRHLIIDDSQD